MPRSTELIKNFLKYLKSRGVVLAIEDRDGNGDFCYSEVGIDEVDYCYSQFKTSKERSLYSRS